MDESVRLAARLLNSGVGLEGFIATLGANARQNLLQILVAETYKEFYDKWHWLNRHPVFASNGRANNRAGRFNRFSECLDIMVAKVDPVTLRIEDDSSRNTRTRVWLECGPIENVYALTEDQLRGWYADDADILDNGALTHDVDLDCGGDTFEEAIITLAALVYKHYGDYTEDQVIE